MCADSDDYGNFLGFARIGIITYQVVFSRFDTRVLRSYTVCSMFYTGSTGLSVFFEIRYRVYYQVGSSTNFRLLIFRVLGTGAY